MSSTLTVNIFANIQCLDFIFLYDVELIRAFK